MNIDSHPQKKPLETTFGRWAGHWLVGNLLLAVSCFLTDNVSLWLLPSLGYTTLIWPESGVALAWVVLYGWRLLPGVALGSFAINLTVLMYSTGLSVGEVSWSTPLLLSLGAVMQAWVGSTLIHRYVPHFLAFDTLHILIKTLALGGILATLVNATWSTTVLYTVGVISGDIWWQSWLIWWLGDSMGVWVFTPLILVWGLKPPFYDRTRALIITAVSSSVFLLASFSSLLAIGLEKSEQASRFQSAGERVVSKMQHRFAEYDQFSTHVRGLFNSSRFVSRAEFKQFVTAWLQTHPEVQAVEWAPRITQDQRRAWQQRLSSEMGAAVAITEAQQDGNTKLTSALERADYLPLEYLEPFAANRHFLGFDTLSNPTNKNILQRAAKDGQPLLSVPLKLIQLTNQQGAGALLYTPVYHTPVVKQPSWSQIKGFIVIVLKNDQVLAYLAKEILPTGQNLLVTDRSTGRILYGQHYADGMLKIAQQMGLYATSTLTVGQQEWQAEIWPLPQQLSAHTSLLTWTVLVISLIGASLTVAYTLVSTGRAHYLEQEITSKTQNLRQKNEELELARVEAEHESSAKGLFLANMSHEIRTPMNGVIGIVELLQATELTAQQQHLVHVLQLSSKALLQIINDILDYSKVEAGKMNIECVDMDLETLLLECSAIFALTAEEKKLDFLTWIAPKAPVFIQSDPTRLRQILVNLLSNAFKFTDHGSISLSMYTQLVQGKTYLQFVVADTGIGISAEQKNKLFQSFSQADSSTTRQFGGTGLGLSLSKSLVNLMHGDITVESQIGQGSTFRVSLPYYPASAAHPDLRSLTLLEGVRVLFVNNSGAVTQLMTEQAQAWGMLVNTVYDSEHALAALYQAHNAGQPYDFVVVDGSISPTKGLALAQTLAQSPELAAIKRILLTSMAPVLDQQAVASAALTWMMQKPTSANILRDVFLKIITEPQESPSSFSLPQNGLDLASACTNKHLLIAEDNLVNQMVLVGMLKKLGIINTEVTHNGMEALTHYQDNPLSYDLILMDCEMPVLDGYAATQKIRDWEQKQHLRAVPIIALTAHALTEHRQHCFEVGMNDFLSKPLTFESLKQMLQDIFVGDRQF